MIYYVDPVCGNDANKGISENAPKQNYTAITPALGDSILFKRGSLYTTPLETVEGVTYGAWGQGNAPTFCGSLDSSQPEDWKQVKSNIWQYTKTTRGKVGNIIFPNGYGTFRWTAEELCDQGDFWDSRQIDETKPQEYDSPAKLLLCSEENPVDHYGRIEICHYGQRVLGYIKSNTAFDGLRFINSGVHGLAGNGKNVVIKNCTFENIGGAMFYRNKKVRFGNAVEFWNYGEDILIEGCTFRQIYDSCITHQGNHQTVTPANNMVCRNNYFDSYGMAAFEYRDRLPINSSFTNNVCTNAGCGFAMQGEELPRYSEIYPQPMGHHIFLWRMDKATEGGNLLIEHNTFGYVRDGGAIYSIISPEAEAQIHIEDNFFDETAKIILRGKELF